MALPSGYERLAYIQSSGTQYIDTGFIPNQDTRTVMDFQSILSTGGWAIFGSRASSASQTYTFGSTSTNNCWVSGYNTGGVNSGVTENSNRHTVDKNKNLCYLDGTLIASSTYATFTAPGAMRLFTFYAPNETGLSCQIKLYSCQIYDNGTLVRDYIPCKNASGETGLWDNVNSKFYANAGTGSFDGSGAEGDHNTNIGGTAREIESGTVLLGGVLREIESGLALVNGVSREIAFGTDGTPIGNLGVDSSVYTNVNGLRKEFLIVHQGNPDPSIYDSSCDGTWLLIKDIYEKRQINSISNNQYQNSEMHTYLNNSFLGFFDTAIQEAIKTVKIPYWTKYNSGWNTGAYGLTTKVFLLSLWELGFSTSGGHLDGAKLDYFVSSDSNLELGRAMRIADYNGEPSYWWSRSLYDQGSTTTMCVTDTGRAKNISTSVGYGVRPAIIVPQNLLVDNNFDLVA